MERYYATYTRFSTQSKKDAALLLGADCLVGDHYSVVFDNDENKDHRAWMKNRFGALVGYFDKQQSRTLLLYHTRGWSICALLSCIVFSENENGGSYWGEAALICFDPAYTHAFTPFVSRIAELLAQGIRPKIDLQEPLPQELFNEGSTWIPKARVDFPPLKKGSVFLKKRRSFNERLIEKGRQKNIGCYIVSWAFLLGLVTLILFLFTKIF